MAEPQQFNFEFCEEKLDSLCIIKDCVTLVSRNGQQSKSGLQRFRAAHSARHLCRTRHCMQKSRVVLALWHGTRAMHTLCTMRAQFVANDFVFVLCCRPTISDLRCNRKSHHEWNNLKSHLEGTETTTKDLQNGMYAQSCQHFLQQHREFKRLDAQDGSTWSDFTKSEDGGGGDNVCMCDTCVLKAFTHRCMSNSASYDSGGSNTSLWRWHGWWQLPVSVARRATVADYGGVDGMDDDRYKILLLIRRDSRLGVSQIWLAKTAGMALTVASAVAVYVRLRKRLSAEFDNKNAYSIACQLQLIKLL